jgi:hypothetical protein
MSGSLKIKTALLVCTAFVFRLLFVNIGIIPTFNTPLNNTFINSHFSTIMKRRKNVDPLNNSGVREYSQIEICEQNSNNKDTLFKTKLFLLLKTIYSFLPNEVYSLKSSALFDFVNSKLSSRKYLAISVLRI